MQDVADQSAAPTTIGADLCAIFVSLELSRSNWLITSLSPGKGEKMSKHSVSVGDGRCAAGALFGAQEESLRCGPEKPSQSSSLKKRGWMASGFTRVLLSEGNLESHVVDAASTAPLRWRRRLVDRSDRWRRFWSRAFRLCAEGEDGWEPRVCSNGSLRRRKMKQRLPPDLP